MTARDSRGDLIGGARRFGHYPSISDISDAPNVALPHSLVHSGPFFREGPTRDTGDNEVKSFIKLAMVEHFRKIEKSCKNCACACAADGGPTKVNLGKYGDAVLTVLWMSLVYVGMNSCLQPPSNQGCDGGTTIGLARWRSWYARWHETRGVVT